MAVKVIKIGLGFTCRLLKACSIATLVLDKVNCLILSCNPNTVRDVQPCITIKTASRSSKKFTCDQSVNIITLQSSIV